MKNELNDPVVNPDGLGLHLTPKDAFSVFHRSGAGIAHFFLDSDPL
jgi:hypothetical protein